MGRAGFEGFAAVLLGFGVGAALGLVRVGTAVGALLARESGVTCDDAEGAPRGVVRAGADLVVFAEPSVVGELTGALVRDAEVLDRDGLTVAPPSGPLGAAARWSGPEVTVGPGVTFGPGEESGLEESGLVAGESITTAVTTAAPTTAAVPASATATPPMRLLRAPDDPRPDSAAGRGGT